MLYKPINFGTGNKRIPKSVIRNVRSVLVLNKEPDELENHIQKSL